MTLSAKSMEWGCVSAVGGKQVVCQDAAAAAVARLQAVPHPISVETTSQASCFVSTAALARIAQRHQDGRSYTGTYSSCARLSSLGAHAYPHGEL